MEVVQSLVVVMLPTQYGSLYVSSHSSISVENYLLLAIVVTSLFNYIPLFQFC